EGRLDAARAEVDGHHEFRAGQLEPARELVDADLVRLEGVPGEVPAHRTLLTRPDRVLPAEARDEVAARIPDGARPELLHELHDIETESVFVGGRVRRLVDAVVHAPAEVFHERSEDAAVDRGDHSGAVDRDTGVEHGVPYLTLPSESPPCQYFCSDRNDTMSGMIEMSAPV